MTDSTRAIRDLLERVLDWEDAHVGFDKAVDGIPPDRRGARAAGFEHSPWELIEHIRIAQDDILEFCLTAKYKAKKWPDDYWPKSPAPRDGAAWTSAIAAFRRDRKALQQLAADKTIDLFATIPHGTGQTYLREILLVADHTSYHVGEFAILRQVLNNWK